MALYSKTPKWIKALKQRELYPEATHSVELQDSWHAYLLRNGEAAYKIYKDGFTENDAALREVLLNKELQHGSKYAPGVYRNILSVNDDGGTIQWGGAGELLHHGICMQDLKQRYFLNEWLLREKLTSGMVRRVSKQLALVHQELAAEDPHQGLSNADHFSDHVEELFFQSKKYLNETITQPMLDLLKVPLERFIQNQKKLWSKRIRKGFIVEIHGAVQLNHVYVKEQEVLFISPVVSHRPLLRDGLYDVAMLALELEFHNEKELSAAFSKSYASHRKDRDLEALLPFYQILVALSQGVYWSEHMRLDVSDEAKQQAKDSASWNFQAAVNHARDLMARNRQTA